MSASSDPETTLFVFLVPQGEWKSVCRIPLSALRELSKRPAKCILFLASIIYGAPGQLHVSGNPMSPEIPKNAGADTETDPAAPPIPLECYFVSRYCPRYVDLRILADRTSARTESNPRNNRFGKRLRNRDRTCVFIQASPFIQCRATRAADCDAAHIIPHSKGREYVQIFEEIHNIPDEERLHGIDDPRNGLLLYKPLHLASGQGECTFLLVSDSSSNYTRLDEQVQVPNRYMDVDDVHKGAINEQYPHGIPKPNDSYEEEFPLDDDDDDDYSGDEYEGSDYEPSQPTTPTTALPISRVTRQCEKDGGGEGEAGERAEAEAPPDATDSGSDLPDFPGVFHPKMSDHSRLILQWVGLYNDPVAAMVVPNNTHATLRQGAQLSTFGVHQAYACAIVNRWGRSLTDGPQPPPVSQAQQKKAEHEKRSPPFSNLTHSFLEHSIKDGYYPNGTQQDGGGSKRITARTRVQQPDRLDWAWDFLMQFHLPPPKVAAQQEAAHQARLREMEEASVAKVDSWLAANRSLH